MDNGFCHISACSHNSRVRNRKVSLLESFIRLFFRVFVPQIATLPSDNSTSEWDRVKYLIDHFDSSSRFR